MPNDARLLYRFNADVLSVKREGDRVTIDVKDWRPIAFTTPKPAYADAVMALEGEGASLERLDEIARASGDPAEAGEAVRYYLERFARGRLLGWKVLDGEGELARADALASRYLPKQDAPPAEDLQLCRFAFLHRVEEGAVLESGLARVRAVLTPHGLKTFVDCLASPRPAAEDGFSEALWRFGFFDVGQPEESGPRRCWEFHDLLMHESSRSNRDAVVVGGTYRFDGVFPSLPAKKPTMDGERIALPEVDTDRVRQSSRPLDEVQAARHSLRDYAEEPISVSALGDFLWRVCRTTEYIEDSRQDLISRPYPAGGSINELEFYLAVRRCGGLEPAVYHYDSHSHALVRLPGTEKVAEKIVERSASAMGLDGDRQRPDLTVVIASRLSRLAWKYEGMAYRASLMNAGGVFDLMYLVATDMGLAPCANGTGDSRLLEESTGLDPFEETAIAEFVLGVPAAT
ncbi:MAG: SagB/ThcOx family dehydrogenase [Rhodospirillaceae bacterium]|jgi:oxazoline/thiazoline dehydrogenase|nr:SagB/ThcOx family dehydrogenase [Rhodospirillaceae bacterium]